MVTLATSASEVCVGFVSGSPAGRIGLHHKSSLEGQMLPCQVKISFVNVLTWLSGCSGALVWSAAQLYPNKQACDKKWFIYQTGRTEQLCEKLEK